MRPRVAHPPSPLTFESGLRHHRRYGVLLAVAIAVQLAASPETRAQDSTLSNADSAGGPYFNPLAVLLNKAFAVSVIESANRKVFDPYGVKSVADALAHPLAAIERGGGWWTFIRQEMLPLTYTKEDPKWRAPPLCQQPS